MDYDEDEVSRLEEIEEKYNAINEKINRKIGHLDIYDDLDAHNDRVSMMEHAINHPIQSMVGSVGLGSVVGTGLGAIIGSKFHPGLVAATAVGGGALMGLANRSYRLKAIKNIDEVRRKRDAFKSHWDKLGM